MPSAGNTKGGSIAVPLTSCLTGLESAVWQLTTFVFICKTDESKPVKQEVSRTVIRPPLVFPGQTHIACVHESLGHSHMRFGSSDFTELCDFDRNPPIFSNHHRWRQRQHIMFFHLCKHYLTYFVRAVSYARKMFMKLMIAERPPRPQSSPSSEPAAPSYSVRG